MTVYFTKNDDFILFRFNMKKLNMFNFLHIKIMKNSFEIMRHYCFVLATTRNLNACVCFDVRKYSFEYSHKVRKDSLESLKDSLKSYSRCQDAWSIFVDLCIAFGRVWFCPK